MRVAVTGAAGFIGKHLCNHLDRNGFRVIPLLRPGAQIPSQLSHLACGEADVTSLNSLQKALENVDVCINLAALFNHPDKSFEDYRAVNVTGVTNVLEAARATGVQRVIHCSTVGVAVGGNMPFSEETPYCPPAWDKYETSKCEGEKAALSFHQTHNYPVIVLRPAQVYGPGDTSKIKFYKMVQKGVIVNPGKTLKHLIFIDDLCRAFEVAITNEELVGQPVIIAGKDITPLDDLITIVARQLGVSRPKVIIPAVPMTIFATLVEKLFGLMDKKPPIFRRSMDFFTKSVSFETARMERGLKFEPQVSVEEGIKLTAKWYNRQLGLVKI